MVKKCLKSCCLSGKKKSSVEGKVVRKDKMSSMSKSAFFILLTQKGWSLFCQKTMPVKISKISGLEDG